MQICFYFGEIFKSVFNENTDLCFGKIFRFVFNENKDLFFVSEKFSDLYLKKIQICFCLKKGCKDNDIRF